MKIIILFDLTRLISIFRTYINNYLNKLLKIYIGTYTFIILTKKKQLNEYFLKIALWMDNFNIISESERRQNEF